MGVDCEAFRAEFEVTNEWAYLNHAGFGPMPRRAIAAVERLTRAFANPPTIETDGPGRAIATARAHVAALVGGDPTHVAFVGNVGDAMSLCAAGIDWRVGDNVVIPRDEFPSTVYAYLNLQRCGVEVRFVDKDAKGFTDLNRIADAIDHRTRALVISHVEFMDGYRNDLNAIGDLCEERQVLSIVDATQSMGVLPIDVRAARIDVIAAHAYKWLMDSYGLGPIHFSDAALDAIRPVYVGRLSVKKSFEDLDYALDWQDKALRFQTGGFNWLSIAAFNESAELIRTANPATTESHSRALIDQAIEGLERRGYAVTSCLEPSHRSAIFSFTGGSPNRDKAIINDLKSKGVIVSLRGRGIRVSPYFYNNAEDVDRLVEALASH